MENEQFKTETEIILQNGPFPNFPWKLRSYEKGKWIDSGEVFNFWLKEEKQHLTILLDCTGLEGKIPMLRYTNESFDTLLKEGLQSQHTLFEIVKRAENLLDVIFVETNTDRIALSDHSKPFCEKHEGQTVYLLKTQEAGSPIVREVYFVLK